VLCPIPIVLVALVSCSVPVLILIPVSKRESVVRNREEAVAVAAGRTAALSIVRPGMCVVPTAVARQIHIVAAMVMAVALTGQLAGAYLVGISVAQFEYHDLTRCKMP
jgi:hypothetical protein